jgi:hypothetical protein
MVPSAQTMYQNNLVRLPYYLCLLYLLIKGYDVMILLRKHVHRKSLMIYL